MKRLFSILVIVLTLASCSTDDAPIVNNTTTTTTIGGDCSQLGQYETCGQLQERSIVVDSIINGNVTLVGDNSGSVNGTVFTFNPDTRYSIKGHLYTNNGYTLTTNVDLIVRDYIQGNGTINGECNTHLYCDELLDTPSGNVIVNMEQSNIHYKNTSLGAFGYFGCNSGNYELDNGWVNVTNKQPYPLEEMGDLGFSEKNGETIFSRIIGFNNDEHIYLRYEDNGDW